MKKTFIILNFVLATVFISSCEKFLDVKASGSPTTDNYFTNDEQAKNAVSGLYFQMCCQYDDFGWAYFWNQCATCMYVAGRDEGAMTRLFTMTPDGDERGLAKVYSTFSKNIANANWIIQQLLAKSGGTELTEIERRSLGEAYFIRGLMHFTLAYRYGSKDQGFPAIKYEECKETYNYTIPPQQATVMDNYKMVIEDFQKAEEYLPNFTEYGDSDLGRASKVAAVAMMVKTYAYWAEWDSTQWDNVITYADKLRDTYNRALAPSYTDLFGMNWNAGDDHGWWGPEYCYSFPCNGGTDWHRGGVGWVGEIFENQGWGVYNGWGEWKPTLDAYKEFLKDGDREHNERLRRTILAYGDEFKFNGTTRRYWSTSDWESGFQIYKWMTPLEESDFVNKGYANWSGDWPTLRVNFTVIRYAEVKLFKAEALLWKGRAADAATEMNDIRARAGLPRSCTGTWAELYHERFCEFAYEPMTDHYQDLVRWIVGGKDEIKAIALKEIEKHPDVRHYVNRADPDSELDPQYNPDVDGGSPYLDYRTPAKVWSAHKAVYPYPSNEISKAAGAIKQNPGYN